nr:MULTISPECIES: ImmA/IrrE family metallo-endopeptidase [Actinomyces]
MPEAFFPRAPAEPVAQEAVFFRAQRRAGAPLLKRSTSVAFLSADSYGEVTQRLHLPTIDVPVLDGDSPEAAAGELRRAWRVGAWRVGTGRAAEPHPARRGPRRTRRGPAGSGGGGGRLQLLVRWSPLRGPGTVERRSARFDLAHELGHLVMHSDTRSGEHVTDRRLEHEANRFAVELLVPRQTLRACVTSSVGLEALRTRGASPGSWAASIGQRPEDVRALTFGQMMLAV